MCQNVLIYNSIWNYQKLITFLKLNTLPMLQIWDNISQCFCNFAIKYFCNLSVLYGWLCLKKIALYYLEEVAYVPLLYFASRFENRFSNSKLNSQARRQNYAVPWPVSVLRHSRQVIHVSNSGPLLILITGDRGFIRHSVEARFVADKMLLLSICRGS